jgi:hypothetical protein
MTATKLNLIAYKTICIAICIFMTLGSWGLLSKGSSAKASVGVITALVIFVLALRKPSIAYWATVIVLFVVAMFIVGLIAN